MATITQFPKAIQPAFNPILLKMTTATSETQATIEVTIDTETFMLTKEFFDKKLTFDLSHLLRKYVDKNNIVKAYSIKYADNTYNFRVFNAVKQVGESTDMSGIRGSFLTSMPFIRYYEGYFTQISICLFLGFNSIRYGTNAPTALDPAFTTLIYVPNTFSIALLERSNIAVIPVRNTCVPESPFYVRWINSLGGWDYWMFGKRQDRTTAISDIKEYEPYYEDSATIKTNRKLLSRQASRFVVAGDEMINTNEFDEVVKILLSPDIEYFSNSEWKPISITNQEVKKSTANVNHSISLEFELPNPILQTKN